MRNIPFKASPKYSFKYFRIAPTAPEQIMHTRHFINNFSTEEVLGKGITKQQVAALPAGIHVIHENTKPKLVKKEIQTAFGSVITSTKKAVQKHHNRRFSRVLFEEKRNIERNIERHMGKHREAYQNRKKK